MQMKAFLLLAFEFNISLAGLKVQCVELSGI